MTITIGNSSSAILGFSSLGLMNLGLLGGEIGKGITPASLLPRNFSVRRGADGPQIIISWDTPLDVVNETYESSYTVRLERRTLDFSFKKGDSTVVYEGTLTDSHAISEYYPDLKPDISYYYTLFIKMPPAASGYNGDDDELFVTAPVLQRSCIATDSGYFNNKLYQLLPGIYRSSDLFDNLSESDKPTQVLAESIGTGTNLAEVFNFKEDHGIKYGPLFRFLKIVGTSMDEIRGLIQHMMKIYDVDSCDQKFLDKLSSNYALAFKFGLNVTRKRADVRNITHFYKWKGTGEGLVSRGEAVSTSSLVYIKEYNENTFLTNTTREIGNGSYPTGLSYQSYTQLTDTCINPNISQRGGRSLLFNAFNGNTELPANRYTNLSSTDTMAQGITFAEITTFDDINPYDLYPYERLDAPGNYTVEGSVRFHKWPKPPNAAGISSINIINRNVEISATPAYTFAVRLNTVRLSGSNHVVRRLAFYVGTGTGTWIPVQLKEELGQINLGESVHFALTRDCTTSPNPTYKVYCNGELVGTDTSLAYTIPAYSALAAGTGFVIGGDTAGDQRDAMFELDEVRVWSTVRTADQISDNYDKTISGKSEGLIFKLGADFKKLNTMYDTSKFTQTATLSKDTNSVYNSLGSSVYTDPNTTYDWHLYNNQKFYKNDNQYYVTGDPVGINGVRMFVYVNNTDYLYPEVTL